MGRRHLYGRRRFRARFRGTNIVSDTLTVTDNRTGKKYELPIQDGTMDADAGLTALQELSNDRA